MPESCNQPTRIAIVGAGNVGSTFAYALMLSGLASEIVMIDNNLSKAEGEVMDLNHSVPMTSPTQIWVGDYKDCAGAAVTVVTAGSAQKPGESRLDLVQRNTNIFKQIIPEVARYNPEGIILIATNPVDVLTYAAIKMSGLSPQQGDRLWNNSGYGSFSLPAQPASGRRSAQCARFHHWRARRQRGAGLVAGQRGGYAPARFLPVKWAGVWGRRSRRNFYPDPGCGLSYHRAQRFDLLRHWGQSTAPGGGDPAQPEYRFFHFQLHRRLLWYQRRVPEHPQHRRPGRGGESDHAGFKPA